MRKWILFFLLTMSSQAKAVNTCGNDLNVNCWECGANCIARLNEQTGLFSIEAKDENAPVGQMTGYEWDGENQRPKTPWVEKLKSIQSVSLPDSLTNIGSYAFAYTNISSINLPDSIQRIEGAAFQGAYLLKEINTPPNLQSVGSWSFAATKIDYLMLGQAQTEIPDRAFAGTKLKNLEIPEGVTSIGWTAFADISTLETLVIPDSVTNIDDEAFTNTNLQKLYCAASDDVCSKIALQTGKKPQIINYSKTPDGKYRIGEKTYASISAMQKGNYIPKRIYTIDEANAVAGEKNRVSIKYR